MNELFKDLIASGTVFVYMDDILITLALWKNTVTPSANPANP